MVKSVETAIAFDNHRTTPLSAVGPFASGLKQAGGDFFWSWDELSGWFPRNLWKPDVSPMSAYMDGDSTHDPFIQAALAASSVPDLGLRLSTDAVRTSPAELMRKLYSLSDLTENRVVLALGAGELRQTKPFGYKRSEGLTRMEDILKLSRLLWDADEPFDFEGNHWSFKKGFIGSTKPARRPEIYALGGGPKLLDLAAQYCDGFELAVPQTMESPEEFSGTVKEMRTKVEMYGRDPDSFGFGVWLFSIIHDDPGVVAKALESPVVKYFAGQFGRLDQEKWRKLGMVPVMPDGWHYAMKWVPFSQDAAEVNDIVARTSSEMARAGYFCGSTAEVSQRAAEWVTAGATFVGVCDMLPLALGPEYAEGSFDRCARVMSGAKGVTAAAV